MLLKTILRQLLRHPRSVAVVDDQRSFSHLEIAVAAAHLSREIRQRTDKPHVGIMLPTGGGFPIALLACWMAGRVPVPLNYLLDRDDMHHVFADSGVELLLTAGKLLDHVREHTAADAIPDSLDLLTLETMSFKGIPPVGTILRGALNGKGCGGHCTSDKPGVLLYTSGTSGKPKGVVLTHGNLEHNVVACIEHAGLSLRTVFLGVLPQFHSFGLTVLTLVPLYMAARAVYTARFVPRRLVELMKEHKPSVFIAVPSMWNALLSVKNAGPGDFDSLRYGIAGGEKLPIAVRDGVYERFGVKLMEGYGLTETSPVSNWSTHEQHREGSVGRALPGVGNWILDDAGQPIPPAADGSVGDGEIGLSGPSVMKGYFGLPELTAEAMVTVKNDRGENVRVFRTGDIGRIDADGFLYITGRKKEMLIVGGENVFPREIEEVLDKHPSVHASAVIGRPDDSRGEVPVAFVELCEDHPFDASEARNFCRKNLPPFKVPRDIHVVAQLPRNPTGKILRRALREPEAAVSETADSQGGSPVEEANA